MISSKLQKIEDETTSVQNREKVRMLITLLQKKRFLSEFRMIREKILHFIFISLQN